jgi:hypothetical protein
MNDKNKHQAKKKHAWLRPALITCAICVTIAIIVVGVVFLAKGDSDSTDPTLQAPIGSNAQELPDDVFED